MGSWCHPRPPSKETFHNCDFTWVDRSFMNSWFCSREEESVQRLHPRDRVKASTRSRHMAKKRLCLGPKPVGNSMLPQFWF